MAKTAFSLAGITLFAAPDGAAGSGGFEVPQELEIGLETWSSVHKLPQTGTSNPKIIVQTFGVFPKPIKWEARFLGVNAEQRAKTLATAQVQQRVVPFVAGARSWDCVIRDFTEKILSRYDIGYSIEILPILERAGRVPSGSLSVGAPAALLTQSSVLQSQQTIATTLASDSRTLAVGASLATSNAAIVAAQPESQSSTSTLLSLAKTVASTVGAANALATTLNASTLAADVPIFLFASNVASAAQSYVTTLGALTGANSANVVTQNGGDLFTVAATQFGDWTRAFDLAAVNGITDPFLSGAVSVTIPQT